MIDHIVCQKTTMPKKTDNDWTPILDVVVVIFYHLLLIVCGGKLLYISTIMHTLSIVESKEEKEFWRTGLPPHAA